MFVVGMYVCEVQEALHTKSEILKGLAKGKRDYVSACVAHWTRAHNQSVIAPPGIRIICGVLDHITYHTIQVRIRYKQLLLQGL